MSKVMKKSFFHLCSSPAGKRGHESTGARYTCAATLPSICQDVTPLITTERGYSHRDACQVRQLQRPDEVHMPELPVFEVLVLPMTLPGICAQKLERASDPYLDPHVRGALFASPTETR